MAVQLTDQEFRLFGEWLQEEFGLRFGPEKRDILRSRLEPRRAQLGMDTFQELYFHLKFHPERLEERERLLPHLTNNESYFFRESAQLDLLRDEVLASVRDRLRQTDRRAVRLLSAGCASGEEPYTLAMIVHESRLFSPPWQVEITGMDLDPQALERAGRASYTDHAFRGLDPEVRARYFEPDGSRRWQLIAKIRDRVAFRRGNLSDPRWAESLPPQDVIFCRNVLIYFDDEGMARAAEGLYNALTPGGYLFLGHADSLSRIPTRFLPERRQGVIFYRRPEGEDG
jgi:chemotaxis protein methyltransferase CheR